ncbi:MAG: glycerate kinase type-2 family protein [Candidatus Oxydemutatoraceae bacterium WSBS_2016_MAG_OTU14]
MNTMRSTILDCFHAGVARVRGDKAVQSFFSKYPMQQEVHIVAIGKAAPAMVQGATAALTDQIKDGLLITKHGHLTPELIADSRYQCIESDHPIPGQNTIRAGQALIDYLQRHAGVDQHFLFLISGGASSLVEVLPSNMSLEDLRILNKALLSTGLEIGQMNFVRRALSQIKAGRLVSFLKGSPSLNLLISDVPGDDPAIVGSGLLWYAQEKQMDTSIFLPVIKDLLQRYHTSIEVEAKDFENVETRIIASIDDAKEAVAAEAEKHGLSVRVMPEFVSGDVHEVAQRVVKQAKEIPQTLLVYGGETQVNLPPNPGLGGRNQHLALCAALEIQGDENSYILSGGTDGTDGLSTAAGGLVDGQTIQRGTAAKWNVEEALAKADSGHFLEASGDLLTTGPTGTNVMDLILAYHGD